MINIDDILNNPELDEVLDKCDPFVFLEWLKEKDDDTDS